MDTDELSSEAYSGIFVEAENFNHDLTLQFGLLAADCENESEYLEQAKKLIFEIKLYNKTELSDLFFGNPPNIKSLCLVLDNILHNIEEVEKIPDSLRKYNV